MKIEVTIGIPVYKSVNYINRTLSSALSQTFPSIEFLIIDDCGNAIHELLPEHHAIAQRRSAIGDKRDVFLGSVCHLQNDFSMHLLSLRITQKSPVALNHGATVEIRRWR